MTGAEALRAAFQALRDAGVEDPARDARLLVAEALAQPLARLTLLLPEALPAPAAQRLAELVALRCQRRPMAQILGRRDFWGRRFIVTPDVLDPRPETETLVAEALAAPFARVLDLGTGSGAILLTLLAERPTATGLGVDLSAVALTVARSNAAALGLGAAFTQSDWFAAVEGRFDLIVSNPPYITEAEMADLSPEVLHEPHLALTPGGDGLAAYRTIAAGAGAHLQPGGRLLVEIGHQQGPDVVALFTAAGFRSVGILTDLDGRDRVVRAQAPH